MRHTQRDILDELWDNWEDLAGDIIALEAYFSWSGGRCWAEAAAIYLRRIKDYVHQHIEAISQLAEALTSET